MLGTETNNSDCDINLKILLISHFMYKRLKNKIKWTFYSIYIFLENSNHIVSTDLSSSQHVCTLRLSITACSIRTGRIKSRKLLIVCCDLLLNDMKKEVLQDDLPHFTTDRWLLKSDFWQWKNKIQQHRQNKHAAVTASNSNGTNYII